MGQHGWQDFITSYGVCKHWFYNLRVLCDAFINGVGQKFANLLVKTLAVVKNLQPPKPGIDDASRKNNSFDRD